MKPAKVSCSSCPFCCEAAAGRLECRLNPPGASLPDWSGGWPSVQPDDWCGSHPAIAEYRIAQEAVARRKHDPFPIDGMTESMLAAVTKFKADPSLVGALADAALAAKKRDEAKQDTGEQED